MLNHKAPLLNIFLQCQRIQKIKVLKYKAEVITAKGGNILFGDGRDVEIVNGRLVE